MIPFQFTVLRYVHNVVAGEYVNIGIVMWLPEAKRLLFQCNERYSRLSSFFSDFDGVAYRHVLQQLDRRLREISLAVQQVEALEASPNNLLDIVDPLLGGQITSFGRSHLMGGLTPDPDQRLSELFIELVVRHEQGHERVRQDEDAIKARLDERLHEAGIDEKLKREYTIHAPDYQYTFHRAWQNGTLQLLEAISLDYVNQGAMIEKANTWSGRLLTLGRAKEFVLTGVVAPPSDDSLLKAFERAMRMLSQAPHVRRVVLETDLDEVVADIERDLEH